MTSVSPPDLKCHHRCLAEQRFNRHQTKPFVDRWNDERGRRAVESGELIAPQLSMPRDAIGDAELLRHGAVALAVPAVTDHVDYGGPLHLRQGAEQVLESLLLA